MKGIMITVGSDSKFIPETSEILPNEKFTTPLPLCNNHDSECHARNGIYCMSGVKVCS